MVHNAEEVFSRVPFPAVEIINNRKSQMSENQVSPFTILNPLLGKNLFNLLLIMVN